MHGRVGTGQVAVSLQPWLDATGYSDEQLSTGWRWDREQMSTDSSRPGSWQAPFWRVLIEWSRWRIGANQLGPQARGRGRWQDVAVQAGMSAWENQR